MGELVMVCGPVGAGKTGRLVEHAARRYQDDRFAQTLVLVPTARHGDEFRRRLVANKSGLHALIAWSASTSTPAS